MLNKRSGLGGASWNRKIQVNSEEEGLSAYWCGEWWVFYK